MSESLQKFQKVSKLGKILSLIVCILACVIAFAMVVGVIVLIILGSGTLTWGRSWPRGGTVVIEEWFAQIGIQQNFRTIIGLVLGVMVMAIIEAIFSFKAYKYFKSVIEAGTPATEECAKSARNFAILSFVLPALALILCLIGYKIMQALWSDVKVVLSYEEGLSYGAFLGVWVAFGVGLGIGLSFISNMSKQSVEEKKIYASMVVAPAKEEKVEEVAVPAEEVAPVVTTEENSGIGYDKSYTGKLMQTKDETKDYYSLIKNEILSYKGKGKKISNRISWKYETFNIGRDKVIKLKIKGKTLCAYFAINPKKYADTKYKVEDVSKIKADAETPTMYRITNSRRAKYVADIVAEIMAGKDFAKIEIKDVNYAKQFPMKSNKTLVKEGLAKQVKTAGFPKKI